MNTLKFGNGEWYGKKDTILAYNDENSNFKPLPFSFDRASSATVINKEGLIETVGSGEPRIDYKDDSKGALLLEPTRLQLIQYSEAFDNGYWTKIGTSVVSGFASPSADSPLNAFKLVEGTGTGLHYFTPPQLATTNGNNTYSFFIKPNGRNWLLIQNNNTGNGYFIDLANKSIGTTTGSPISYNIDDNYTDGWLKISFTDNVTTGLITPILYLCSANGSTSYTGDGTSGVYVWGAQFEQGSYATSYIPSSGGVVTRIAESCSQTVPSGVIGQTEGVIYWEGIINGFDVNFSNIVTGEKNTTTSFAVLHKGSSSQFQCSVFDGSEKGKCIGGSVSVGETCKIAYAYKSGNFALYVNGVSVATSTDTWTPPSTIDDIFIGDTTSYFGNQESNSHKQIKLYNTRLSNAELQVLTTI